MHADRCHRQESLHDRLIEVGVRSSRACFRTLHNTGIGGAPYLPTYFIGRRGHHLVPIGSLLADQVLPVAEFRKGANSLDSFVLASQEKVRKF
jgi:hypothetical protein